MTLILASKSSIRAELLTKAGLKFEIQPADIDETPSGPPLKRVFDLAATKAAKLSSLNPEAWVIGADQVGYLMDGQEELQKPQNPEEAVAQIGRMSGKTHCFRSVAVLWHQNQERFRTFEDAQITFRDLSSAQVAWYVGTQEWKGCCGGYRIEAQGIQLVQKIEGSLMAIYGLPLVPLLGALHQNGLLDPSPSHGVLEK